MIKQVVGCDAPNCKTIRGESNHWWAIRRSKDGSITLRPLAGIEPNDVNDYEHYCGQGHLVATLQRYLNGDSQEDKEGVK